MLFAAATTDARYITNLPREYRYDDDDDDTKQKGETQLIFDILLDCCQLSLLSAITPRQQVKKKFTSLIFPRYTAKRTALPPSGSSMAVS